MSRVGYAYIYVHWLPPFWSIGFVICPVTNNSDSLTGFLKRGKDTTFMQRVIHFFAIQPGQKRFNAAPLVIFWHCGCGPYVGMGKHMLVEFLPSCALQVSVGLALLTFLLHMSKH